MGKNEFVRCFVMRKWIVMDPKLECVAYLVEIIIRRKFILRQINLLNTLYKTCPRCRIVQSPNYCRVHTKSSGTVVYPLYLPVRECEISGRMSIKTGAQQSQQSQHHRHHRRTLYPLCVVQRFISLGLTQGWTGRRLVSPSSGSDWHRLAQASYNTGQCLSCPLYPRGQKPIDDDADTVCSASQRQTVSHNT